MQLWWYFFFFFFAEKKNVSAKATHIFSAKNIRILCIESAKTVNEMTLNELVKLTTLWTTGPRVLSVNIPMHYTLPTSAENRFEHSSEPPQIDSSNERSYPLAFTA